jgi:hypothetical protein
MKLTSLALAATLATTALAQAQTHKDSGGTILPGIAPIYLYISAGSDQMALAVGTNTTLTVPAGATIAEICVETAGVRYRDTGSAATSLLGIPVSAGTCWQYSGPLSALSFTAQSGSPTLDVLYYRAN